MILHGDCRQQLSTLPDCSVDAIVTDPPYELGFMGKRWDASGIAYDGEVWSQCLRVLKPGGHLCAFGGTRTYHRMTVAIEDAGFEIRDSLHWLYGSGFPKSLDVSKAIDKAGGDAMQATFKQGLRNAISDSDLTFAEIDRALGVKSTSCYWVRDDHRACIPARHHWYKLQQILPLLTHLSDLYDECEREIIGKRRVTGPDGSAGGFANGIASLRFTEAAAVREIDITSPATDAAERWQGWGTALKPAHEPIVLARKPLAGTVATNIMEYGTGALNIDATRVGANGGTTKGTFPKGASNGIYGDGLNGACEIVNLAAGRWPANIILTHAPDCEQVGTRKVRTGTAVRHRSQGNTFGSAQPKPLQDDASYADADGMETVLAWNCGPGCPVALLNEQSGERPGGAFPTQRGKGVATGFGAGQPTTGGARSMGDSGGASRFFTTTEWDPDIDVPFLYVAKPSRKERNAGLDGMPEKRPHTRSAAGMGTFDEKGVAQQSNFHPTVKPVALIRHLIRLITPPGGTVLDPFLGSGTTAVAAILEGFDWVGCELTDDYLPIIEARTTWAEQNRPEPDLTLFTEQP